jgi:hypothetical protein
MEVTCTICGKTCDTKKEDVFVTVGWVLEKIAKDNGINHEGFPRVSMVCNICWNGKLKKKPEGSDYFWTYSKEV